jgi:Gpi18-like mannosyltransferase
MNSRHAVLTAYAVHTGLIAVAFFLTKIFPNRPPAGFINESLLPLGPIIGQLVKWDAHWYTYIAQNGYDVQSVVFFPAIIVCMKTLAYFGLNYVTAGLLACNLFAFLSFQMMYLTFRLDFSEKVAQRALLAYSVMPTSFFINSIYTESLFLVFSLSCVYYARQSKWMMAGVYGALSALTRNLGVFLFFYLLYEYWQTKKSQANEVAPILPLFFPPIALLAYMGFNLYVADNPLAFLHSQQGWGRYFNSPLNSFSNNIALTLNTDPYIQPGASLDTFMVLLAVAGLSLLSFSTKFRSRQTYLLIGWLWLAIPLASTSAWLPLYSASRFVLVIFPLYLFLAQLRDAWYYSYLAVSSIMLCICAALFMNWHWVG